MRPIDADALGARMYYEAFEKDSADQRWDSGCWIRYKLFEKVLKEAPTIEERKTGKWIDKWHNDSRYCDQCGAVLEGDYWYWRNNYYCYHCGAKMEVEDAETNF